MLVFIRLYLSFFGFGKLIKLLKIQRSSILNTDKMHYVIKSIEISSSIIPNITCLVKAAVLKIAFNNLKDLRIIIGIRNNKNNSFQSHAWVTHSDEVILNDNLKIDSYKVIYII